jgi:hypothetical protein
LRRKRTAVFLIGIGVILLAAGMALPVKVLTVRLPHREFKPIIAVRVTPGSDIRLKYRHSVELTEVEGRFRIGPGPVLLIKETRFTSIGSGLPNTRTGKTRRENGWFVVDEGLKVSDEIRFFISPVNRTRLIVDGRIFPLFRLEPGTLISIDVERMPMSRWLLLRPELNVHEKLHH